MSFTFCKKDLQFALLTWWVMKRLGYGLVVAAAAYCVSHVEDCDSGGFFNKPDTGVSPKEAEHAKPGSGALRLEGFEGRPTVASPLPKLGREENQTEWMQKSPAEWRDFFEEEVRRCLEAGLVAATEEKEQIIAKREQMQREGTWDNCVERYDEAMERCMIGKVAGNMRKENNCYYAAGLRACPELQEPDNLEHVQKCIEPAENSERFANASAARLAPHSEHFNEVLIKTNYGEMSAELRGYDERQLAAFLGELIPDLINHLANGGDDDNLDLDLLYKVAGDGVNLYCHLSDANPYICSQLRFYYEHLKSLMSAFYERYVPEREE